MELLAIKDYFVIYKTDTGAIVALPMDKQARQVLKWNAGNIPANDKKTKKGGKNGLQTDKKRN